MIKLDTGLPEPAWGPTGAEIYSRTYSRVKEDGTNETWEDTVRRVVRGNTGLVDDKNIEANERERLFDLMYNFKILPAGRHLWMSGVPGRSFLYNCFVSGWTENLSDHFAFTFSQLLQGGGVGANYSAKYLSQYTIQNKVELNIISQNTHRDYDRMKPLLDNDYDLDYDGTIFEHYWVEDSREGWVECLKKLIDSATTSNIDRPIVLTLDMSDVRPAGEPIHGFGGTASGPVPLMEMLRATATIINGAAGRSLKGLEAMDIEHAIASCVVAGNVRRSARMSIMHWADEAIFDFISCKEAGLSHWTTNISVEIDDVFIALVESYAAGEMQNSTLALKAHAVYRALVEGMLKNGEPGIWNSSLSQQGEVNTVIATNPCGEIVLEGFEPCNLGHINIDAFVSADGSVDLKGMEEAHRLMTRFLMRATYGDITDAKTQRVNDRNRRIGVGHFGYAGFLAKQRILFSESHKNAGVRMLLLHMADVVDTEKTGYAHKLRIPVPVKSRTVAPTGTIAKLAGRGEGIHPVYSRYFTRRVRYGKYDPRQAAKVEKFRAEGYNVVQDVYSKDTWVVEMPTKESLVGELEAMGIEPFYLQSQDEIALDDFLRVQAMYQECWADNAVSFTVNVPKDRYSVEEVMGTLRAHLSSLKGTTLMVDESRELAPYERITAAQYESSTVQTEASSVDDDCKTGACPVK